MLVFIPRALTADTESSWNADVSLRFGLPFCLKLKCLEKMERAVCFFSTERDTESPQNLNQTPAVYTHRKHISFQSLHM